MLIIIYMDNVHVIYINSSNLDCGCIKNIECYNLHNSILLMRMHCIDIIEIISLQILKKFTVFFAYLVFFSIIYLDQK